VSYSSSIVYLTIVTEGKEGGGLFVRVCAMTLFGGWSGPNAVKDPQEQKGGRSGAYSVCVCVCV